MFLYEIDEKFEDLTIVKQKDEMGYAYYVCKCKCGRICIVKERDVEEKKNCGQCYNSPAMKQSGRPELGTDEYKKWRNTVYIRDKFRCVCCGSKYKINAHHLNAWASFPTQRYDVNNGITLCGWSAENENNVGCHDKFHDLYGKGANTREQFNTFFSTYYGKTLGDLGL